MKRVATLAAALLGLGLSQAAAQQVASLPPVSLSFGGDSHEAVTDLPFPCVVCDQGLRPAENRLIIPRSNLAYPIDGSAFTAERLLRLEGKAKLPVPARARRRSRADRHGGALATVTGQLDLGTPGLASPAIMDPASLGPGLLAPGASSGLGADGLDGTLPPARSGFDLAQGNGVKLDLGYKYFDLNEIRTSPTSTAGGTNTSGNGSGIDWHLHTLMLDLKYAF